MSLRLRSIATHHERQTVMILATLACIATGAALSVPVVSFYRRHWGA